MTCKCHSANMASNRSEALPVLCNTVPRYQLSTNRRKKTSNLRRLYPWKPILIGKKLHLQLQLNKKGAIQQVARFQRPTSGRNGNLLESDIYTSENYAKPTPREYYMKGSNVQVAAQKLGTSVWHVHHQAQTGCASIIVNQASEDACTLKTISVWMQSWWHNTASFHQQRRR